MINIQHDIILDRLFELAKACNTAGNARALKSLKPKEDRITQNAAYREFGEAWIDKYKHLLTSYRVGKSQTSRKYYSRAEIFELQEAIEVGKMREYIELFNRKKKQQ